MENISLEKIYAVLGELYLTSRVRITELEQSLSTTASNLQSAVVEKNRLLAEISHMKITNEQLSR